MTMTVFATYDHTDNARDAVDALNDNGFDREDIGLAVYDREGEYARYVDTEHDDVDADEGAGAGAGFGALLGAAVGLAAITIPGVGPVVAAGPLSAALGALIGGGVGAVAGGVTGGLTAALVDLGLPEEDAHYYAESVRRGAALVTVRTDDNRANEAMSILQRHRPINIDERIKSWRDEGWTGFDANAEPYDVDAVANQSRYPNPAETDATVTEPVGGANRYGTRSYPYTG